MAIQVFISYPRKDYEIALQLRERLVHAGHEVWQDTYEIRAGDDWTQKIEDGLRSSTVLVLLLSEEAIASHEVKAEWHYFRSEYKPIIPVIVRKCNVPYFLRWINYVLYFDNPDRAFDQILETVERYHSSETTLADEIAISDEEIQKVTWDILQERSKNCVDKSIRSDRYSEKYNSDIYFERIDTREHLNTFLASKNSVMVVTGKAGTGKSSFICNLATNPPENTIIFLQDCATLSLVESLEYHIAHQLDIPPAFERIMAQLEKENPDLQYLIILDGINENKTIQTLMQNIQRLITLIRQIPNLKLLITCRLPSWNMLRHQLSLANEWTYQPKLGQGESRVAVELQAFSHNEVKAAYKLYQERFNLRPDYNQLPEQVQKLINKPIFMKLIARAHRNKVIKDLTLREVFRDYLKEVLGEAGFNGLEYTVMKRIAQVMRNWMSYEIEKHKLAEDKDIGSYVQNATEELHTQNPFAHLLNEGVVSVGVREHTLTQIELIFFTYELILEYLLSDIAMTGNPHEVVLAFLSEVRSGENYFPQLRGAAELAVCFRLLDDNHRQKDLKWLRELAESDLPDIHPFLIGVIQTISDAGGDEIVDLLFTHLMASDSFAAHIIVMQAAYLLKRDDFLIRTALKATTDEARDTAVMYIYQRWNYERRQNSVNEAYEIVYKLVDKVRWRIMDSFLPPLQALLGVSFFIGSEAVGNREQVIPLVKIYREMVLPQLGINQRMSRIIGNLIGGLSPVVQYIMRFTIFSNQDHLKDLLTNDATKRTLLDMWFFIDAGSLENLEQQLIECLNTPNPMIAWFYRAVMMYYMYNEREQTTDILINAYFDEALENNFVARFDIAYSIVFGTVINLMRGEPYDPEIMPEILEMFDYLWKQYLIVMAALDDGKSIDNVVVMTPQYHRGRMEALISGIFAIEAIVQNIIGADNPGSGFLRDMFEIYSPIEPRGMQILVGGLEKMAYYMIPEFALQSLLQESVVQHWIVEDTLLDYVVTSFAKVGAFYPDEVTSMIRHFDETSHFDNLLPLVERSNAKPNSTEARSMTNSLWTSSVIIEPAAMKVGGVVLFDLARSKDTGKFLGNAIETVVNALLNPRYADTALVAWFDFHRNRWDAYDRWQIPRDVTATDKESYEKYKKLIQQYVDTHGSSQHFASYIE